MDEVIGKIKEYVIALCPELEEDSNIDFIISDVVDRFLAYTNRQQLVAGYERFLTGDYYDSDYVVDVTGKRLPILPIPVELERTLARVVVSSYKGIKGLLADSKGIKSISDNGQSISYGDYIESYFNSKEDDDIFGSAKTIIDRYRIPTIVRTNFTEGNYSNL
jgi:hypothetical protein